MSENDPKDPPKPSTPTTNAGKMYEAWLKNGKTGIKNRLRELKDEKEEDRLEQRETNSERES